MCYWGRDIPWSNSSYKHELTATQCQPSARVMVCRDGQKESNLTRKCVPWIAGLLIFVLSSLSHLALASPACVNPEAKNFVLASSKSTLADGWNGEWLLQSVDSGNRIFLRRCSEQFGSCYFATDVKPGKYYFQQVVPSVKNDLLYPVTNEKLWFTITGMGVDYIGHWIIRRQAQREVTRLEIHYELSDLDNMIKLCEIKGRKVYLDQTRAPAHQVVD